MALLDAPHSLRPPLTLKTWGRARHGVLGHGDSGDEEMPRQLEMAVGITAIACGELHCIALTDTAAVLTWGSGMLGALGHGVTGACRTPAEVVALKRDLGHPIVQVCAGRHHSLARSSAGEVFVWGTIGTSAPCEPLPRRHEGFDGWVAQAGCGDAFCAALIPTGVVVWGGAIGANRFSCAPRVGPTRSSAAQPPSLASPRRVPP